MSAVSRKEKLKVLLWSIYNYPSLSYQYWQSRHERSRLQIYSSEETIKHVLSHRGSVARLGDGELRLLQYYYDKNNRPDFDSYQDYNEELGAKLADLVERTRAHSDRLLLCLPHQLINPSISNLYGELFWKREWIGRKNFLSIHFFDRVYGDTNFVRFYMGRKDIKDYPKYIELMQQIWKGKRLTIVEGRLSRLGVGNDFFDAASVVQRIICPAIDAFSRYDEILSVVQRHVSTSEDNVIVLALGPTATLLAADLSDRGHQAIDIGHVDIEYEWYRMGAKEKVAIPNKYVNEVASGRIKEASAEDAEYEAQIIARID